MMPAQERVLVLGANGFIGSHLVDSLVSCGFLVRAFGRFENEPLFNSSESVEIFKGDFLNQADLERALEDVSYVFHLISTTTPATSDKDPTIDLSTNVAGSIALFQKCIEQGKVKRIVFASSGGTVYGDGFEGKPFLETDPTNPISPYGIGKLAIENYLHYYNRVYGQDYVVLRIANPYGGRQKNTKQQGIMPVLINNITNNNLITLYGDGSMVRDYIYIDDLVNIMVKSLQKSLNHKIYNVSSGIGTSINELVRIVEEVAGKKAIVQYADSPATFVQTSVLDNARMKQELQTELTDLHSGISSMCPGP